MEKKKTPINQQGEIRQLAMKIAKEQIAPQASESDRKGTFPRDVIRAIGEAELPALVVSEKEGGAGEGRVGFASVVQDIAKAALNI